MALRDLFKVSGKTFFNPKAWIDYDNVKAYNIVMFDTLRNLFAPIEPGRKETFTEAMQRQGITEAGLVKLQRNYFITAMVFVFLALITTISGFYQLFSVGSFFGWIISLAATALFLAQAFRYHFWSFQIKHRKLGCTFDEWLSGKIDDGQQS